MHRISNGSQVTSLPTPAAVTGTPGFATPGNPGASLAATTIDPDAFNAQQEEIIGVVIAAGLTPSKTNNAQLLQAIPIIATGRFISTTRITSAGTIAAPAGATTGRVRAVGGGGGGGSMNGASTSGYFGTSGGGGSGSYADVIFLASVLSGLTATPGAGGTYGVTGGATTIGTVLSVPGGLGSGATAAYTTLTVATPAAGGATPTTTGTMVELRQGSIGLLGVAVAAGFVIGGAGGNSRLGNGGGFSGGTTGVAAVGPGGGGGGASINPSSAQTFGGTGGNGEILIDWFS
jgi:hypothetical protein